MALKSNEARVSWTERSRGRRKDGVSRAVWAVGRLHSWFLVLWRVPGAFKQWRKSNWCMFKGARWGCVWRTCFPGDDGWVGVTEQTPKNTAEHLAALPPMRPGSSVSQRRRLSWETGLLPSWAVWTLEFIIIVQFSYTDLGVFLEFFRILYHKILYFWLVC